MIYLENNLQHCIHFQEHPQEVEEEPHLVVVAGRNQEHQVGFAVAELPRPGPYRLDSTGHMRHNHHKLRMDPDLLDLELHSTERIGLRSQQLQLDFQHQERKG